MKNRKRNSAPAAEISAETEAQAASDEQAAVATLATIEPVVKEPVNRKGKSTTDSPVARVWLTCHNMIAAAATAGTPAPSRKHMVATCIENGIAFYTARTQVQAYLKASKGGTIVPEKLPKGLSIQ
jgi:hypothetical protein